MNIATCFSRRTTLLAAIAVMLFFVVCQGEAVSGTPQSAGQKTDRPAVRLAGSGQSNLISDDFNDPSLNPGLWTFVDPLADCQMSMNGKEIKISVPAGTVHDAWTGGDDAPRIMQPTNDADFQVIVKIDSPMTKQYQTSGILVQETPTSYLRFDIHSDGSKLVAFAASILNNVATAQTGGDVIVDSNGVVPLYLMVKRTSNSWQMSTSKDGSAWTLVASFNYTLVVSSVGIFVGNEGVTPPAFTGAFDFFQTAIPKQPTLLLPANGATAQSLTPQLIWAAFSGALTYHLQVATDSAFAAGIVTNDSTLTDSTKSLSGLAYTTKYFWRVSARNASTGTSAYTRPWSFTTNVPPPATPVLLSPATNTVNAPLNVVVRWHKSTGAGSYHLQAGTDSLFAGAFVVNDSTLTDTSRAVTGVINATKYFWRVRAIGPGGSSAYAAVWNFTTIISAPGIPTLVSPVNGAIDVPATPQLRWHAVPTATQYAVKLGTDSTFATGIAVNDSTVTDSVLSVAGLTNGTSYYWEVRAKNVGGTSGPSVVYRFATIVGMSGLVYPPNGAGNIPLALTLQWRSVKNATRYWLQLATDSTFATGLIKSDSTLTDTSRAIVGLIINQRYFWRVNAKGSGGWGGFSPTSTFLTETPLSGAISLISPTDLTSLGSDSVKFVWHSSQPLIQAYDLEFGPDSAFVFTVSDTAVVDTFKTVKGLLSNTRYFWRVRAKNPGGWGPYSTPTWSFNVLPTGVNEEKGLPREYSLDQNYPNPFNPATMITFSLPKAGHVQLEIFNVLGQKVATLIDQEQPAGIHTMKFDGTSLSSGIYIYRLVVSGEARTFVRKMILAK
ncbi:MAG: T9SS type A sorting domain-containing protein [Bacteroidota bacterium]